MFESIWSWIVHLNVGEIVGYVVVLAGGATFGAKLVAGIGLVKSILKLAEGKWLFLNKWAFNLGVKLSKAGRKKFGVDNWEATEAELTKVLQKTVKSIIAGMRSD